MSWNFYNLHYTVSALLSDRQLIMGMSLLLKHITQNEHLSVPIKPWKGTMIGDKTTKTDTCCPSASIGQKC